MRKNSGYSFYIFPVPSELAIMAQTKEEKEFVEVEEEESEILERIEKFYTSF